MNEFTITMKFWVKTWSKTKKDTPVMNSLFLCFPALSVTLKA